MAPEGRKILIGLFLVSILCGIAGFYYEMSILKVCFYLFGIFFLFSLNFFRDPHRITPQGDNLLIAPADGKVVLIKEIEDDLNNSCNLFGPNCYDFVDLAKVKLHLMYLKKFKLNLLELLLSVSVKKIEIDF